MRVVMGKTAPWLRSGMSFFVVCTLVFADAFLLLEFGLQRALTIYAAQVQIDTNVGFTLTEHIITGAATVFISDQVGYKFYVDRIANNNEPCVYSKTTNGGISWSTPTTTDIQGDCASPVVWYDRWTPGDTGNYIHIATLDPGEDDLWYNRLDTTSDTLLLGSAPVNVTAGLGYAGALSSASTKQAITKGTDGTVYIGVSASDSLIVECSSSCESAGNWSETGTTPLDNATDYILMLPQSGGNIMLIRRDVSLDDIQFQLWNNSIWPGPTGWSTIDSNAFDNTTYDSMMAAVVNDAFEIFLTYIDAVNYTTANHDIRTAKYASGNWTNTTDVTTNDAKGLTNISIGLDANTNDVYVAFSARTTIGTAASANVYYATSTNAMGSWSAQQGPVNTTPENIAGVDINHRSDERIHVSWYGETSDDVFGDTLADVSPQTRVSSRGSQVPTVRASSSATHVGGVFVLQEFQASRFVTSVTISETGTIDGATGVGTIALYYDFDTTAPYDCIGESYAGTESQFGVTDTNGFSGANGVSIFTDAITISPTQSLCLYPVTEVLKTAIDGTTLEVEITNPATDVVVSTGSAAVPSTPVTLPGTTTIVDDELTQTHFHFRNDDGSELAATSRTSGVQDTTINALQIGTPIRLRFGISNAGSTSTFPISLQLDYATTSGMCSNTLAWEDVGAVDDAWNMFDSVFIADGANSTNIATTSGGVGDENVTFLTPNGGLRDASSVLSSLTFLPTNWTEAEFSIIASTTATEGQTYCFRLSDAGVPLSIYSASPQVTISADVRVRTFGTHEVSTTIPSSDFYTGGGFSITENTSSRSVTSITLAELGTINASTSISSVRLYYNLDTTAPYDCVSESYTGAEAQFGATSTSGFSGPNGTVSFTDSVTISTTSTLCVYPVVDVTESASNAETMRFTIVSASSDVLVSGSGSVSPATALEITGSTTLQGGILSQLHYHWRLDNGDEITASSAASTEDTPLIDFTRETPIRLRLGIDNAGPVTSTPANFRLEYGIKLTSCENVAVWTDVGAAADAWDMFDTSNLTEGGDTTDVSGALFGEVSNPPAKTFLTPNGGVRDISSQTSAISLTANQFTELEYSITSTASTSFATNYCFRVTNASTPLPVYVAYAEVTTVAKRDFRVQRGTTVVSVAGSTTITAGPTTYTAPASSSLAFVRITNMHHTGAGRTIGDNTQEADDVTVYISDVSNLATSFTLWRYSPTNNTVVSWEIVEFIGELGTDNEVRVRDVGSVLFTGAAQIATGTVVANVASDTDMVIFITGSANANTGASGYFNGQVTAEWDAATNQPVFKRIGATSNTLISYAAVEFTGINWRTQRIEHSYTNINTAEVESIAPVGSLSRTFIHAQKRMGAVTSQASFGHEVWLSSIGAVSFRLPLNAATTTGQVSVAWVIENTQTSEGKMLVQPISGSITGGTEPRTASIAVNPVSATNNTSVFGVSAFQENTINYPRVLGGLRLASTTAFEIYNSDITGTTPFYYRVSVVEWPTTGLSVRQNYYRFYVNNDSITPNDPWPPGPLDVGENTVITALDEPVAEGDVLRLRVSLQVTNAPLPAGLRTYALQYGQRTNTCNDIVTWNTVGAIGSGEIWRGHDTSVIDGVAISGTPPTPGDLLLSGSDVAGRVVEANPSAANPYDSLAGDAVEYDFVIEHNGAVGSAFYCFRVVGSDGEVIDGYDNYPELRTAGYTPVIDNWRWYSDYQSETPASALSAEQVTPIEVANSTSTILRMNIGELKNVDGLNVKFKLQYSEYPDFRLAHDVVASSSCLENSLWCYADGGGEPNQVISTALLSNSASCDAGIGDGCGTHNEDGVFVAGDTHLGGVTREYSFAIRSAGARVNAVYYFRAFDVTNNGPLSASSTYPSLATEGAVFTFQIDGIQASTTIEGTVTTATSTATGIDFGTLPMDTDVSLAQRLTVFTNGTQGYQVFLDFDSELRNVYGDPIPSISATNASPALWSTLCTSAQTGCFGYHAGDDTLFNGSVRFALNESFAGVELILVEVMASNVPVTYDVSDVVYRTRVGYLQPAGNYSTVLRYIAVPIF